MSVPIDDDLGLIDVPDQVPSSQDDLGLVDIDYLQESSSKKSLLRSILQPFQGALELTYPGIAGSLWSILGAGDALDPDEIERLKEISAREGVPFDEEKYREAAENALKYIPTVSNIGREIEQATGVPLEAKSTLDKLLRSAGGGFKLSPGGLAQKAQRGAATAAIKGTAEAAGLPEPISDLLAYPGGQLAPTIKGVPSLAIKTKPSGLPERRFESIKKPTKVSPGAKARVREKLEGDFKKISNEIIEKSPVHKLKEELANNPKFKPEMGEKFNQLEELSKDIPEKIPTDSIKKYIENKIGRGSLAPTDYQRELNKQLSDLVKETKGKDVTAHELVRQYRENNKSLKEYFEPGKSKAQNRAKRDALLIANEAIGEAINTKLPYPEFGKIFEGLNKRWSLISDTERLTEFTEDLFSEGINFSKAKKLFDDPNLSKPMRRVLGEDQYNKFEKTVLDLLGSEKPYNMLKEAKSEGFLDLARILGSYLIHPKAAVAAGAMSATKEGYKAFRSALIDKPKIIIKWNQSIDNLKKGNFSAAEKYAKEFEEESRNIKKNPNR